MGLRQSYQLVPLTVQQAPERGFFIWGLYVDFIVHFFDWRINCVRCHHWFFSGGVMRFLSILFLIVLSLHSYLVFAQTESAPQIPLPSCSGTGGTILCSGAPAQAQCANSGGFLHNIGGTCWDNSPRAQCLNSCTCPSPYTFGTYTDQSGNLTSGCKPPACDAGESWDIESESCVSPGGDSCEESEKVYDPISGSMVCPGSGDSSSSASSNSCVVPGDFNGDCIPDDQQGSSAPSSTPASAAASSVATSSGGDGDDGSGNNGGGGGNNNNGGNNNGGGGSASSAASASSKTGGAASSAGAGQCDPTAKNYLACIGSQKMSGEETEWEPVSANGNWIPVTPGSNCPNKYQDINGQWWCWGGEQEGSSSSGSNGSASSGANNSASSSLGYSGSDGCDSEPVCPAGEPACLQLLEQWQLRCGGVDEFDDKLFELEQGTDGEGEPVTFSSSLTSFKTELEQLPNVVAITQFFSFNASGSCPTWQVSAWVFDINIDQLCSDLIPWEIIAGILIAVSCLIAARIALT